MIGFRLVRQSTSILLFSNAKYAIILSWWSKIRGVGDNQNYEMQRRRKNEWWRGYYLPLREKSRHGYTSRSPFRVKDSYCATVQHSERADRHTVESPIQPFFTGEDHIQKYPTIRLNIAGKQKGNIQVVSGVVSTSEYLFGLGWQVRSGNGLLKVVG